MSVSKEYWINNCYIFDEPTPIAAYVFTAIVIFIVSAPIVTAKGWAKIIVICLVLLAIEYMVLDEYLVGNWLYRDVYDIQHPRPITAFNYLLINIAKSTAAALFLGAAAAWFFSRGLVRKVLICIVVPAFFATLTFIPHASDLVTHPPDSPSPDRTPDPCRYEQRPQGIPRG